MDLYTRQITVTFDEIDSNYVVSVCTSLDGTITSETFSTLPEVFCYISELTKTKIVWIPKTKFDF